MVHFNVYTWLDCPLFFIFIFICNNPALPLNWSLIRLRTLDDDDASTHGKTKADRQEQQQTDTAMKDNPFKRTQKDICSQPDARNGFLAVLLPWANTCNKRRRRWRWEESNEGRKSNHKSRHYLMKNNANGAGSSTECKQEKENSPTIKLRVSSWGARASATCHNRARDVAPLGKRAAGTCIKFQCQQQSWSFCASSDSITRCLLLRC